MSLLQTFHSVHGMDRSLIGTCSSFLKVYKTVQVTRHSVISKFWVTDLLPLESHVIISHDKLQKCEYAFIYFKFSNLLAWKAVRSYLCC